MKRIFGFMIFFALAFLSDLSYAAFVNSYSVNNWNKATEGLGGDIAFGPTDIATGSVNWIKITSSNDDGKKAPNLNTNQSFTIIAAASGLVTFDWLFSTSDSRGAQKDPFYWVLNGVQTELTSNGHNKNQSGPQSFAVNVGDTFGFILSSFDSKKGSSSLTISNFSAPIYIAPAAVPVPATFWLIGTPLLGLLSRKRKTVKA